MENMYLRLFGVLWTRVRFPPPPPEIIEVVMKDFREIEGQERAIFLLQKAYRYKKVSHAYIFLGPSGVGKSLVAKIFIKLLNCENASKDLNPCNECNNCKNIDKGSFIDLIHIKPNSSKEIIKISTIRDIEKKLAYRNYKGNKKIVFIENSHQMNISSFNALLKNLEEPPDNTMFILTANGTNLIPQTILSRTAKVIFNPLSYKTIYNRLTISYPHHDKKELKIISRLSQGSMSNAMKLINNNMWEQRYVFLKNLFDSKYRFADTMNFLEEYIKKYAKGDFSLIVIILEFLKTLIRDSLLYKLDVNSNLLINKDIKQYIKEISKISRNKLINHIEQLTNLQYEINSNANTEMLVKKYFIILLRDIT